VTKPKGDLGYDPNERSYIKGLQQRIKIYEADIRRMQRREANATETLRAASDEIEKLRHRIEQLEVELAVWDGREAVLIERLEEADKRIEELKTAYETEAVNDEEVQAHVGSSGSERVSRSEHLEVPVVRDVSGSGSEWHEPDQPRDGDGILQTGR
jgi:chromosome segregation ATPase